MPLYDYFCEKCDESVEVIKPMSESSKKETCSECGNTLNRVYSASIQFTGTKVKDAEYYVPFDKVIKNDRERKEEIKKRNLIEVGNEKPEVARHYMERHRKEKLAKDYED